MKKLAILLALLIIPCTAFGLEMLTDNAMDNVTAQSGVSIAFDDVQVFINIEKLAWVDCDGFTSTTVTAGTCTGTPGAISLNNFQIDVLNVNAIVSATTGPAGSNSIDLYSTTCGLIPLFYDYGTSSAPACSLYNPNLGTQNVGLNNYIDYNPGTPIFLARALTIDATSDLPALTEGFDYNNPTLATCSIGGVLIGIPTMEIYINDMSLTPEFDDDVNGLVTDNACNDGANYGVIVMQGVTLTTLSGWIEIAPH